MLLQIFVFSAILLNIALTSLCMRNHLLKRNKVDLKIF